MDVTPRARVLSRAGSRARRRDHSAARVADASRRTTSPSATAADCRGATTACSRCATTRSTSPGDWLDPRHAALDVSAHEWLRSLGLSERAIALAYGLNVSFGRDAHDVSALAAAVSRRVLEAASARSRSTASLGFTARHGVQRIPEAMAGALAGGVELGREVVRHRARRDNGAVVTCADGHRFAREARDCGRAARRAAAHRDRPEAAGRASRRRRDLAVATVDAGLSRAAQPLLGARRLRREPVHGHARRHARGRAQSRRSRPRSRASRPGSRATTAAALDRLPRRRRRAAPSSPPSRRCGPLRRISSS